MGKTFNLELEDILVLALLKTDENTRTISYVEVESYGKELKKELKKLDCSVIYHIYRDKTYAMLEALKHYFSETEDGQGININDGVTKTDLRHKFIGCLPIEVLIADHKIPKS